MTEPYRYRILLIEDSEADAVLVKQQLSRDGVRASYQRVDNPADLQMALEKEPWDIALCDYAMPGFSGLEALKLLREKKPDMPCIIVSGQIGEEVAVEAMRAGAGDYIMKDRLKRLASAVGREIEEARARKESEQLFSAAFYESSVARAIARLPEGSWVDANERFLKMFEYAREEVIGRTSAELNMLVNPSEQPQIRQRILEEERMLDLELAVRTKTGKLLTVLWSAVKISLRGQEYAVSTIVDITDRKRLEEEREQLIETLVQERTRLRTILKQAPTGIVVALAPSGTIILSNDQANKIFGVSSLMAGNIDQYEKYHGFHGDGRPYKPEEWPLARSIRRGEEVLNEEIRILREDGTEVTALVSSQPVRVDKGRVSAGVVTFYDITALKLAEIKDQFIGMVSHEIKNPLTVVIGALQVATDQGVSEEQARELINDALASAESLISVVDNLLELSRYQANRLTLQANPASTRRIAGDVVQRLRGKSAIHTFVINVPDNLPPVLMDSIRGERILYNLVDNAIKYSPNGGQIEVFARQQDDHVLVGVRDPGVGISPEDQARLFQDFERLDIYSRYGIKGTGLGLKVCRILVQAHGGRMWVESAPGKGTTFYFTVPLT